jgi:hypothetical protein
MRKALFLFHCVAVLFAADPPYFLQDIEGYYLPDIVSRHKATLAVGTIDTCKQTYAAPTYAAWECNLINSEIRIDVAGTNVTYVFTILNVSEYQWDPKEPSNVNYAFLGNYQEVLPDGVMIETPVNLTFERNATTANAVRGRLSLSNWQLGGLFAATIK